MLTHPQPEYRQHKTISQGQFAPGAAILQSGFVRVARPVNSATRYRFRFKCSVAGTLSGFFLRPGLEAGQYIQFEEELDGTDAVATTGNPDPVVVVADTEAMIEIDNLSGEAYVLIQFEEEGSGAGTVTYANDNQV